MNRAETRRKRTLLPPRKDSLRTGGFCCLPACETSPVSANKRRKTAMQSRSISETPPVRAKRVPSLPPGGRGTASAVEGACGACMLLHTDPCRELPLRPKGDETGGAKGIPFFALVSPRMERRETRRKFPAGQRKNDSEMMKKNIVFLFNLLYNDLEPLFAVRRRNSSAAAR